MNSKLLAFAVAAALVAPVAHAEVTLYGTLDGSVDSVQGWAKGSDVTKPSSQHARHYSQISSNSSNVGVKGSFDLGGDMKALFQAESYVNLSNSTTDPAEGNGAQNAMLGSRNSFIGIASSHLGAVKLGKSDTPYKTSTGRLDPFANTVGDYNGIMGNTGGDNRNEFDLRASHAVWYESPKVAGFSGAFMFAPGQQANGNSNTPAVGEGSLCTGGNYLYAPGTSSPYTSCTDGGFGSLYSANVNYEAGPLFLTGAYELHKKVDRTDDFPGATASMQADEHAFKVGGSWTFADVGNKVGAVYERMARSGPADDRTRNGYFLSDVQKLPGNNDLMLSWTHAGRADNVPASANTSCAATDPSCLDDAGNLYAVGARHYFNKHFSTYAVFAMDKNHVAGHYGLGQSGHGDVVGPNGTAGETFKAVSIGGTLKF